MSGGSKARKLVDLKGFSVYFDTEILGELEGQQLEVEIHVLLMVKIKLLFSFSLSTASGCHA